MGDVLYIYTWYSSKGGVGRSMAVLNAARNVCSKWEKWEDIGVGYKSNRWNLREESGNLRLSINRRQVSRIQKRSTAF